MHRWYIRLFMYVVVIIGLHFLVLAYLLNEILQEDGQLSTTFIISISFIFFFLLLSYLVYRLMSNMLQPIVEITTLMKDLNKGHYWRRLSYREDDGAISELVKYTNQLANNLQQATEHQHIYAERLQAVINNMISGLLFIDQKGRIAITNHTLLDMLGWSTDYHHEIYYETPLSSEVIGCIRDAFTYEEELSRNITLELGLVRKEINLLIAPVQEKDGIVTGVVLVFHDITDLKKLEQIRKDFVANVSHELKTPITSIKGFSETLLDGAMYSEDHLKEFLEIIWKESERLHRLIHDLLDLSHIEQRKLQLKWEKVDLEALIQETLTLIQPKAQQKKITLTCSSTSSAHIEGDKDRLHQVMLNLLSNAIQYTPSDGHVEVKVNKWEDQGFVVCIKDTGIGLKEQDIPRIFERFYRVDQARSRSSGGTGLGLAIVKHLIDAHHGKLEVISEEGKGSKFCVYLYEHQPLENESKQM